MCRGLHEAEVVEVVMADDLHLEKKYFRHIYIYIYIIINECLICVTCPGVFSETTLRNQMKLRIYHLHIKRKGTVEKNIGKVVQKIFLVIKTGFC